jgi:DNA-binding MarR family transcriptional regulator
MTQVEETEARTMPRARSGGSVAADGVAPAGVAAGTRWLDAGEREVWLGLMRVLAKLPPLLDAQLERTAGLTLFEYTVLSMLSEQEDRALRMTRLATLTNASPSRLSHAARHLEARGLLVRAPDPDDGRCIRAVLTRVGQDVVSDAAPGHLETVRGLVIDALGPDRLRGFSEANERILGRIDPDQSTRPPWLATTER